MAEFVWMLVVTCVVIQLSSCQSSVKVSRVKELQLPDENGDIEGDIRLTEDGIEAAKNGKLEEYLFGSGSSYGVRRYGRWPKATIPYTFDSTIAGESVVDLIEKAIARIQSKTCLKFIKRTTEKNYIKFVRPDESDRCDSWVGMVGGDYVNVINLGTAWYTTGCWSHPIVEHEIGHALGFYHEQSRPDRDNYVRILDKNIKDGRHSQFVIHKYIDSLGVPYDLQSGMHYRSKAFGKWIALGPLKKTTIETIDPSKQHFLDASKPLLSDLDMKQLNLMYQCRGKAHIGELFTIRYKVTLPFGTFPQRIRTGGCPEHHLHFIRKADVRSLEQCAHACSSDDACANFVTGKYKNDVGCYLYRAGCSQGTDVTWYDTWVNAPKWKAGTSSSQYALKRTLQENINKAIKKFESNTCFRFKYRNEADIEFRVGNRGSQESFLAEKDRFQDTSALVYGVNSEVGILNAFANALERNNPVPPGARGCEEHNIDYHGNEYVKGSSFWEPVKSWQECARLCSLSTRCLYWSWKPIGRCYSKNSNAGRRGEIGTVSGAKHCQGVGPKSDCTFEEGYCLDESDQDQQTGVVRLDDVTYQDDIISPETKEQICMLRCQSYPGATGCEWWPKIWGCNVHTKPISRGSGKDGKHMCSVFKKCKSCAKDGFSYTGSRLDACSQEFSDSRGCSEYCSRTNGCRFWTWLSTKKCCLMKDDGKFVAFGNSNVVSGPAGCMDGAYTSETLRRQDFDRIANKFCT